MKSKKKRVVLLASGGLDSTTLAYFLRSKGFSVLPVFVDYGQHCAKTELDTLLNVLPFRLFLRPQVITMKGLYEHCSSRMLHETDLWKERITDDDLYVPYRNQLILSAGAAVAQANDIKLVFSAFIQANIATGIDCSDRFLRDTASLTQNYGGVVLKFPFMGLSKAQVAKRGVALKAPIALTYSCLVGAVVPCGVCPNCVDRQNALRSLKGRQ